MEESAEIGVKEYYWFTIPGVNVVFHHNEVANIKVCLGKDLYTIQILGLGNYFPNQL